MHQAGLRLNCLRPKFQAHALKCIKKCRTFTDGLDLVLTTDLVKISKAENMAQYVHIWIKSTFLYS